LKREFLNNDKQTIFSSCRDISLHWIGGSFLLYLWRKLCASYSYTLVSASITSSIALSSTPLPTAFLIIPTYSTTIPYPTASIVKANAVALVSQDWEHGGPSSLWVSNVDGSGERKIVDSINELENGLYVSFVAPKWSPDGKWISYISDGDLWIVSPDGSTSRRILSIADKNNGMICAYKWSPDSSQIAYAQGIIADAPSITVGIIDLTTGEISEILSYQSPPPPITLLWSSDGHYLLLSKYNYFFMLDVANPKVIKEIKPEGNCLVYHHGVSWSPNDEWFYYIQVGNGRYSTTQICVAGLDGSNHQIDIDGTATSYPVWDKAGNFLYFIAANTDFSNTPLSDYDLRLMRYDVRTQKQERLLSLGKEPRRWSVSISPDGQTLELHTIRNTENLVPFIFMDIQSLSVKKFSVNLELPNTVAFSTGTAWSPDNRNIILFSGGISTPNGVGVQPYGAFYTLNIQTGEITVFSGSHNIELDEWVCQPPQCSTNHK
jgi:Tol biopolymer transport system component